MKEIKTLEIAYTEERIVRSLGRMETNMVFSVKNMVYYPYMFYEFSFQRSNPISPLKGNIGCSIDAISGTPALIDQRPNFQTQCIPDRQILAVQLNEEQTQKLASEFLFRMISKKVKVISAPNISMKHSELFHRPYWVISGNERMKNEGGPLKLIVDSITGKYHPLNV